jgi:hypothetical protein
MDCTQIDYRYERAHYPNTVSWYRELIWLGDELVGEINEPTDSTTVAKKYRVCKYSPLQVLGGTVDVAQHVQTFSRVCDAKEFVNNGGIQ